MTTQGKSLAGLAVAAFAVLSGNSANAQSVPTGPAVAGAPVVSSIPIGTTVPGGYTSLFTGGGQNVITSTPALSNVGTLNIATSTVKNGVATVNPPAGSVVYQVGGSPTNGAQLVGALRGVPIYFSPFSAAQIQQQQIKQQSTMSKTVSVRNNYVVATQFSSTISNHLDLARDADSPSAEAFNGETYSQPNSMAGVSGPDGKNVQMMTPHENKWGFFFNGVGGFTSAGNSSSGYSSIQDGGFLTGLDYKVSKNFIVGVTGGYTYTSTSIPAGYIYDNAGKFGVYGTYFVGGFYSDVAVLGGIDSYDPSKGAAKGLSEGTNVSTLLNLGYDYKIGDFTVGPIGEFDYIHSETNGYTQFSPATDAYVKIPGQQADYFQSKLGGRTLYKYQFCGMTLTPELRASWEHQYGVQQPNVPGDFASPTSYLVGRDSCALGAGASLRIVDWCSVYAYYDGDLGRENYISHNVTAGVHLKF